MEANLFSFHLRWSRTFKPVSHQKVTAPTCSATLDQYTKYNIGTTGTVRFKFSSCSSFILYGIFK